MTFKKYQTRNNIAGFLDAWISPTTETLILKPEYANLFPEITEEKSWNLSCDNRTIQYW